ncbi:hypothetical protein GGR56DRAFT_153336 [Xylariaceae sp. FL0804]|nr:hypothetical protein GGR56DRAFT_153336 [Xylariaceae sp. FL0804]
MYASCRRQGPALLDGCKYNMIHFQPSRPTQLRRACDRCHRAKKQCFRDSDEGACRRCIGAKFECFSSPADHSKRRKTNNADGVRTDDHRDRFERLTRDVTEASRPNLNTHYSTLIPSASPAAIQQQTTSHTTSNSPLCSSTVSSPAVNPVDTTVPSSLPDGDQRLIKCLRQLSDLNVSLMCHLATLHKAIGDRNPPNQPWSADQTHFQLDRTLNLSQLFIDILSNICPRLPPSQADSNDSRTGNESSMLSLDPSSELLVFSTYLRLIEIYIRYHGIPHRPLCTDRCQGRGNAAGTRMGSGKNYPRGLRPGCDTYAL